MDGQLVVSLLKPHTVAQNVQFITDSLQKETREYTLEQWNPPETKNLISRTKKNLLFGAETYIYLPRRIQDGIEQNALFAYRGRVSRDQRHLTKPELWQQDLLGPYAAGNKMAELKLQHFTDISTSVEYGCLFFYDNQTYIIGTSDNPSPFRSSGRFRGSMAKVAQLTKQYSFKYLHFDHSLEAVPKDLFVSVVGRINNNIFTEKFEDGRVMVWAPNEMIEWGHLFDHNHRVSAEEAKAKIKEKQHLTFLSLAQQYNNQGWYGRPIHKEDFHAIVFDMLDLKWKMNYEKRKHKLSLEDNLWEHCKMLARNNPDTVNPYGFKMLQIGEPIFICKHCKKHNREAVGRCLGRRLTETDCHKDASSISSKVCSQTNGNGRTDEILAPALPLPLPLRQSYGT
jgi:hypothetical protein